MWHVLEIRQNDGLELLDADQRGNSVDQKICVGYAGFFTNLQELHRCGNYQMMKQKG